MSSIFWQLNATEGRKEGAESMESSGESFRSSSSVTAEDRGRRKTSRISRVSLNLTLRFSYQTESHNLFTLSFLKGFVCSGGLLFLLPLRARLHGGLSLVVFSFGVCEDVRL